MGTGKKADVEVTIEMVLAKAKENLDKAKKELRKFEKKVGASSEAFRKKVNNKELMQTKKLQQAKAKIEAIKFTKDGTPRTFISEKQTAQLKKYQGQVHNAKKSLQSLGDQKKKLSSLERGVSRATAESNKVRRTAETLTRNEQASWSKGGFKQDLFLPFEDAQNQFRMFGKEADNSFQTVKGAVKETVDTSSKEIADLEKNFESLQEKMSTPAAKKEGKREELSPFQQQKFNLKQTLDPKVFDNVMTEFKKLPAEIDGKAVPAMQRLGIANKKVSNGMKARTKKLQGEFKAWALSIMFFGMAIQRAMTQIWQFGSKAFNEIQHSVKNSVTGFDMLQGSLKFLGYTIGAALEPMAQKLIPIVEGIAEWVSKNEKLTAGIVKWGTIFGGFLFVAGTVILGVGGISTAFLNTIAAVKKLKTGFDIIKNANYAAMWTKIKTSAVTLGTYLGGVFKTSIQWIKANPIKSIMGVGVLTGIILAFGWLNRMQKAMGGWDELGKNALRGLLKSFAGISAGFQALVIKARDAWKAIFNKGEGATSLSFDDAYNQALTANIFKLEEDFGVPLNGYITESKTLKEIWEGDIYPAIEDVNAAMGDVANTAAKINEVSFSDTNMEELWAQNLLKPERVEALLSADSRNDNTVSDTYEALLKQMYAQSNGTTYQIDNITIDSNADSINNILESLKQYT